MPPTSDSRLFCVLHHVCGSGGGLFVAGSCNAARSIVRVGHVSLLALNDADSLRDA